MYPLEKCNLVAFLSRSFYSVKSLYSLSRTSPNASPRIVFHQKKRWKILEFWLTLKLKLTSWENKNFAAVLNRSFCNIKRFHFIFRTFSWTFSRFILHKNNSSRNVNFLTKTMDQLLWKNANFGAFLI